MLTLLAVKVGQFKIAKILPTNRLLLFLKEVKLAFKFSVIGFVVFVRVMP